MSAASGLVTRLEPILVALFFACWLVNLLQVVGLVSLAGSLDLSLYPLYSLATLLGWLAGNLYVHRARGLPAWIRRRLLVIYFIGPPGILYLVRAMAPHEVQLEAPMVPIYSFGVFGVLFLVPVVVRRVMVSR